MLQLQRASAGSGKTYTLAKKFIWFFITIKADNGGYRLRTDRELSDSLSHILAITFTNKATNEMKERIVEKLAAIAFYQGNGKKPDYLTDYVNDLNLPEQIICATCGKALKILLNNFSDFNVSTIDSFFQSVLRTFAYEVDLNDSYQVELDSKYLSKVSIDETLESLDRSGASHDTKFWIGELMKEFPGKSSLWNIFQKYEPDSSKTGEESSYSSLLKSIEKLENEEYKQLRPVIEKFFNNGNNFRNLYTTLKNKYEGELKALLKNLQNLARDFVREWNAAGLDLKTDGIRSLETSMKKILAYKLNKLPDNGKFTPANYNSPNFCKKKTMDKGLVNELREKCAEVYEAKNRLDEFMDSEEFRHWLVYRHNLPFLGLMKAVADNRAAFLQDNNLVELSETSSMLRRIIGDDDTPFIYERLGTKLNHFLIDEFQDTSRLQWENLSPLLKESMSRNNDNLIIGDAKQSIYRFRNADPSIINTQVPDDFDGVEIRGMAISENTNWRSYGKIVSFNNGFFSDFSSKIEPLGSSVDFKDLYSNVEQHISKSLDKGFVKVTFCSSASNLREKISMEIGPLIKSITKRGFKMSDIAVLVSRNSEGQQIIGNIIDYNQRLGEDEDPIEFISEESLQLGNSKAVGIIISVLENIARGTVTDNVAKGRHPVWNEIKCNFNFFAMRHHGIPTEELMDMFLDQGDNYDRLQDLLAEMQSVALPSLVEAVAKAFVPAALLSSEAAYIAALQDFVLDFCERRDTDIPSFLQTWERKGKNISISSPEGLDAVQIMTIHKSKGLEFKCVIIPYLGDDYSEKSLVKKSEWKWVHPYKFTDKTDMPDYMPVSTDNLLKKSIHATDYNNFIDLKRMDFINNEYVAFTRAEEELYIYAECKWKPTEPDDDELFSSDKIPAPETSDKIGYYLYEWLKENFKSNSRLDISFEMEEPEGEPTFTVGSPFISDRFVYNNESDDESRSVLTEYFVNDKINFLKYKEDTDTDSLDEEDPDPRSEGNLLHAVMENIDKASDLPLALRKLELKGRISLSESKTIEEIISEALKDKRVEKWFDGTYKTLRERTLLSNSEQFHRPDRIMVDSAGNAIVVDYKFGEIHEDNRYRKQVGRYIDLLKKSGIYSEVAGYLWYVKKRYIEEI